MMQKRMAACLLAVGLALGFSAAGTDRVMAEERIRIDHVNLHIQSDIQSGMSGGKVKITPVGEAHYRVGGEEILNNGNDWIGGMTPRVSFELYAADGYYFGSSSKSFFTFEGNDASFVTARREDDQTLMAVTIRLDKLENGNLTIEEAAWDGDSGTAVWKANPNAKYYQVRLFRDDDAVTGTRTAYDTYYEFGGSITRRGDYYFEVRAVGGGAEKGDWDSSDSWYVSAKEADEISDSYDNYTNDGWNGGPGMPAGSGRPGHHGGWSHGASGSAGPGGAGTSSAGPVGPGVHHGSVSGGPGWRGGASSVSGNHWCQDQRGKWYQFSDGRCPRDCWEQIDGTWYCFGQDSYLRCGWIEWGGKWYYTDSTGAMLANTRTPDNCYVGVDGAWIP